eukprot:CAMPEP_0195507144 /NCGR_PEP_ID=MMETSP0794_2-20130614/644_1 /TAXON_ID=515487 /ORGANISM="Stephanopyxis turris, Strain CCMP 815" /LENGTH=379 /DNA_ID=CAMNT_0040633723 /DNA_START=269 /DNA_END=1408 /DNA_ORIENTATION=+
MKIGSLHVNNENDGPSMSRSAGLVGQEQSSHSSYQSSPNAEGDRIFSRGAAWAMWDRQSVIGDGTCLKTPFQDSGNSLTDSVDMCVHPENDPTSAVIAKYGRLPKCDTLTSLWKEVTADDTTEDLRSAPVFVDVGSGIGSCVLQMLFTTNANIVAFEPHPSHLFLLTTTLLSLDESFRNRVSLFPFALGRAKAAGSVLHTAIENEGNSVLGPLPTDKNDENLYDSVTVNVERLDSMFDKVDDLNIALMNMNVLGSECEVLRGMTQTLQHVQRMEIEYAGKWLDSFEGCSESTLLGLLRDEGFMLYHKHAGRTGTSEVTTVIEELKDGWHCAYSACQLVAKKEHEEGKVEDENFEELSEVEEVENDEHEEQLKTKTSVSK